MEKIVIKVGSENTSMAIREFVSHFADASVSILEDGEDETDFHDIYGIDKATFEERLDKGINQTLLGMTKSWDEVKAELISGIRNR